jgi:hypothetical protein
MTGEWRQTQPRTILVKALKGQYRQSVRSSKIIQSEVARALGLTARLACY